MVFDKKGTTTTVFQEDIDLINFLENLNKGYDNIKNDHLIINLFSFDRLTAGDVLEFLKLSKSHKATNKSFVVVTDKVAYDEVPEEIVVVPTLQEARDIIEMEEIERDLGI